MVKIDIVPGGHREAFTGIIKTMEIQGRMSKKDEAKPYKQLVVNFDDEMGPLFLMINVEIMKDGNGNVTSCRIRDTGAGGRFLKSLETQGFDIDADIVSSSEELELGSTTNTQFKMTLTATMGGRVDIPIKMKPLPTQDGFLNWEVDGTGDVAAPGVQSSVTVSADLVFKAMGVVGNLPAVFNTGQFVIAVNAAGLGEDGIKINESKVEILMDLVTKGILVKDGDNYRKVGA